MYRHLFNFVLGIILGILLITNITSFLTLKIVIGIIVVISLFLYMRFRQVFFYVILGGMVFGMTYLLLYTNLHTYKFPDEFNGTVLVVSDPKEHSFYGRITDINGEKKNIKVSVRMYDTSGIEVNDLISFDNGTVSENDVNKNPGGFNFDRYYKSEGMFYTLSINEKEFEVIGKGGAFPFKQSRYITKCIKNRIDYVFLSKATADFYKGLLLGDKVNMSDEMKGTFSALGISHILAVSGMHVCIVVMIITFMFYPFKFYFENKWLINFFFLSTFCFITGLEPSVIRASFMIVTVMLYNKLAFNYDSLTVMGVIAFFFVLQNPYVIYNTSFQLSFLASIGISVVGTGINRSVKLKYSKVKTILFATIGTTVVTLPIISNTFGEISLISFVGNLIIIPVLPALYALGLITTVTNGFNLPLVTEIIFTNLYKFLHYLSVFPFAQMTMKTDILIDIGYWMLAIIPVIYFAEVLRNKIISLVIPFAIAVCFIVAGYNSDIIYKDKLKADFINVGQADCCLINNNNNRIMIDTGTESSGNYDVVPYLRKNGIRKIDLVVISHLHDDHAGGFIPLADNVKVCKVVFPFTDKDVELYDKIVSYCIKNKIEYEILYKSKTDKYGDIEINMLKTSDNGDGNENEIITQIKFGKSKYLFAGDAVKEIESEINDADCDVLKVAHHGSDTSTGELFLRRATPDISIISVGKDNKYKHPNANVVERILYYDSDVYRTDNDGLITVISDKEGNNRVVK